MSGLTDRLREPAEANADELGAAQIPTTPLGMVRKLLPRALMMLGAALFSRKVRGAATNVSGGTRNRPSVTGRRSSNATPSRLRSRTPKRGAVRK